MSEIVRCAGCGIVRSDDEHLCAECGTAHTFTSGRSRLALAGFLGSVGLALTLAACYGGPTRPVPKADPAPTPSASGSTSAP